MTFARRLRAVAVLAAAGIGLSACAELRDGLGALPWEEPRPAVAAPAPAVTAPRPAKAAPAKPSAKAERKAKPAEPEAREIPRLVGLSEAETAQLLGQPAEESEQPPGKVWVYKATGCRLAVHLFPDMEKGGFYTLDTIAEEGTPGACVGKLAADARRKE